MASHCITSHQVTGHHIASHQSDGIKHIGLNHIASRRTTHHSTWHDIAWHNLTWLHITSHDMTSLDRAWHHITWRVMQPQGKWLSFTCWTDWKQLFSMAASSQSIWDLMGPWKQPDNWMKTNSFPSVLLYFTWQRTTWHHTTSQHITSYHHRRHITETQPATTNNHRQTERLKVGARQKLGLGSALVGAHSILNFFCSVSRVWNRNFCPRPARELRVTYSADLMQYVTIWLQSIVDKFDALLRGARLAARAVWRLSPCSAVSWDADDSVEKEGDKAGVLDLFQKTIVVPRKICIQDVFGHENFVAIDCASWMCKWLRISWYEMSEVRRFWGNK